MKTEIATKYKEAEVGTIPKGWIVVNFDKILSLEYGKALKEESRTDGEFPVYGSNGVVGFHNEKLVDGPGIIVGRKGSAGEIIYSSGDFFPIDTTYFVKTTLNKKFVYYLLKNTNIKKLVGSSAVPGLNRNDVYSQEIVMPAKHNEQIQIAEILSSLDDKIELNNKINTNLEKLAGSLFKKWFVDIGDDLPKGWRMGTFGEAIENFDSKRIPLSGRERKQGSYPYYGATSIMDYVESYIFDGTYVLLGEDGSVAKEDGTPFVQYVSGKIWVNNHAHVLIGKNGFSTEYIKVFLDQVDIMPFVTGAVQPKLNQANMNRIPMVIPDQKTLGNFNAILTALFEMILKNESQNKNLEQVRDSLSPRLMSGKIRVN